MKNNREPKEIEDTVRRQVDGAKGLEQVQREIRLPHAGIVVLVGPSNSGKSTLLDRLVVEGVIRRTEAVSSDQFRMLIGDDEYVDWKHRPRSEADVIYAEYQQVSAKAFEAMEAMLATRCRLNKLTWVDATHLYPEDRQRLIQLARKAHVPVIAVVLDIPEKELLERDAQREYPRGRQRVKQQVQQFKRTLRAIREDGFDANYVLKHPEDISFVRTSNPLIIDMGTGIDIIGDIHGCYEEMMELILRLGYVDKDGSGLYHHPEGRKLVSVGDVTSRGPESLKCLLFWQRNCASGLAYMIDSNHGWKIGRYLDGRDVTLSHGDEHVEAELIQLEQEQGKEMAQKVRTELRAFLLDAPSHLIFSRNGVRQVVVAHAGIRDHFIGKQSKRIQDYCRYGDVEGTDEHGRPIRKDWYVDHASGECIVWGHDPHPYPTIVNDTINIDQGVVFGGMLTAWRMPEREAISVPAKQDYAEDPDSPLKRWERRRFAPPNLRKFKEGFTVQTGSRMDVSIHSEVAKTAIDTFSHFTVPLEELVYIPPTMSPPPTTSSIEGYLEHPKDAFQYYRSQGVTRMVAEKKHMGSRAIVLLFRDEQVAEKRIGRPTLGNIVTRTGRSFFDRTTEKNVLLRLHTDLIAAGYFDRHQTEFVLLDAEIVPWNLKARELISSQYAHVAEASLMDRELVLRKLHDAEAAGRNVEEWLQDTERKLANARTFRDVFQKYCWDVKNIGDIRIAPFHTLAHSTGAFWDQTHEWHMEQNREFARMSTMMMETEYRVITSSADEEEVIRWWDEITAEGHEGIVIKPETFRVWNANKMIQPAIKVRGRAYLHIIYGMDYLAPENLSRLSKRKTSKKERHALMESALGMEGIERFVRMEPVERIHECVLATLALESEPVDPRL
ncbi:polynucleotide kinase-phosphatase [Paenibacillus sp. UMB7766-LJ446]|uniref:polynucleotide kinase-phosphatase n=1 Tax=Paenibacillus sp. UMB7766-LJ446 TaxID=3046313 RepID=UPI002550383E|nr:polynucleotide kinase-phosphatase [Paenibacillus sp. UMB7766-LJ446]MDK8191428.1 polynucleotide kinase-phosphatase [Paenibacillus sp. UMB7766-LJ446]